ncbi:MAG: hypothetical protein IJM45_11040 [Clostridia bacterium]|nr:hypothetical protein [Clostridia bacterium]MCR5689946.1 hypothetical protein [Clostridiales bacterium]
MKKVISVILAVILAAGCFAVVAGAADSLSGEYKYFVSFTQGQRVHYTVLDEMGEDYLVGESGLIFYKPGAVCHFKVELDDPTTYKFTGIVTVKVNDYTEADYDAETGIYSFRVTEDSRVKISDTSVISQKAFSIIDVLMYWIKFIVEYLRNVMSYGE